jgi:hypothetical protein
MTKDQTKTNPKEIPIVKAFRPASPDAAVREKPAPYALLSGKNDTSGCPALWGQRLATGASLPLLIIAWRGEGIRAYGQVSRLITSRANG